MAQADNRLAGYAAACGLGWILVVCAGSGTVWAQAGAGAPAHPEPQAITQPEPKAIPQPEPRAITQYVQSVLTDKSGLPQNSVAAIAQTPDGYLWFGTQEGLARYDGLRVTVFDTLRHKALKDNYIQALAAAADGSLWVGTRTALTRFKDGHFTSYLTAQSPITTILAAQDGRVWVGSLDGLYAFDPAHAGQPGRLYKTGDGLPSAAVSRLAQTQDGTLWVATPKGLARLAGNRFESVDLEDPAREVPSSKNPASKSAAGKDSNRAGNAEAIVGLAVCADGSLWIARRSGVIRWHGAVLESIPAKVLPPRFQVADMHVSKDGSLWIAFAYSGLAVVHQGKLERYTAKQGLPSDDIGTLFEDREGHLWVGLAESGVVQLRDGVFTSFGESEGLSENMAWTVLQARDGSLWVGTNSKGLNHVVQGGQGRGDSVRVYTTRDGLPQDSVYALHEGLDGSIWVGTEDGSLSRIKDGRITVYRDLERGARIVSILDSPSGHGLLVAFHQANGLAVFDPEARAESQFRHFATPGLVNTATVAPDGSVWLGTDHGGVLRVRLASGGVNSYTTEQGLLTNFAQSVYVDREGVVWAGTSPGGLNRIKDGRITTYSIEQGLFDLTVGAIVEDREGYLWMTCNKGIYKVSKRELTDYAEGRVTAIHSIVYGAADGLRSVEGNFAADPSVWKGKDGRLWFATTAGVASIDPARSAIHTQTPPVLIEEVFFDQKLQTPGGPVSAAPGHGDLEIRYTAPDFVAPQRIQFRYRLRGADADWVYAGERRQAFYTKLTPGNYLFEVQAAVGDQNWTASVASLSIVLQPHFWQTVWFRALCILTLALLAFAVFRIRLRYYVERNRALEERVNERTAELRLAIRAAEAAHHALHEQASHDGLTGLWNRRTIFEMLGKELQRAQRETVPVALLMADVDHFKLVNDTHGHLAGDCVLQEVARRMQALTRSYDFAGRYGGEEFVVVLPNCQWADAVRRAEEFRAAIGDTPIPTASGALSITGSIGVAVSSGTMTAEELIHRADEALYTAKRAGRNRVHPHPPQELDAVLTPAPS